TRTDAELSAAVQNALQALLPQIRAEIREEFRTGFGPLDSGGNPPPVTIHNWLECFNKQKPRSFEKATAPVPQDYNASSAVPCLFIHILFERVIRPLALRQAHRPRSDHGKARHFISSTFAHHNHGSSSHQEDDNEDDGASRASTPSPTTYLNSLKPFNYQQYEFPSPFEQSDDLLFERQTELVNQSEEIHKEVRGGFKSFGKALRGVFGKKKK
nr:zinc finger, CCHC-type, retrotransposon Gag domain protein [Tanacetum cinerariifolium]